MGVETRSQMTNHFNGNANHSKSAPSLSLSFFLYVSPPSSFLSQSVPLNCLKVYMKFPLEGTERVKRWTVRGGLSRRKALEKAILVLNMSILGLDKLS